jgi:aquaporin Z
MLSALRRHWPEYLIEAAGLGVFMVSACVFATLLQHPSSPLRQALPDAFVRRALMGLAMGSTAIAIIYSPWGKQSGAHINPAVTLAFYRLGRVPGTDAAFYTLAQFAGGVAGVALSAAVLGPALAHPSIGYAATVPGRWGVPAALGAETAISFFLMLTVLVVSNSASARWTGLCAGALVALYITFEDPVSGMSMNPARTFGSALPGGTWTALWIYFAGPVAGMLLAAQAFLAWRGRHAARCAKLHHQNDRRCIFCMDRQSCEALAAGAAA